MVGELVAHARLWRRGFVVWPAGHGYRACSVTPGAKRVGYADPDPAQRAPDATAANEWLRKYILTVDCRLLLLLVSVSLCLYYIVLWSFLLVTSCLYRPSPSRYYFAVGLVLRSLCF